MTDLLSERYYYIYSLIEEQDTSDTGLKIKTFEAISYDKVTMVHPHSMKGVFEKDKTSLFFSDKPQDWIDFLVKLWRTKEILITDMKKSNGDYMRRMNEFIVNEYIRFLND